MLISCAIVIQFSEPRNNPIEFDENLGYERISFTNEKLKIESRLCWAKDSIKQAQ